MGFFTTIKTCLAKYLSVAGTANRREFWFWLLFASLLLGVTTIIDGAVIAPMLGFLPFEHEAGTPLSLVTSIALLAPTITVAARRVHDSEWSAWWLLIALTGIGSFLLLWLFIKSGKKSNNRYT